MHLGGRGHDDQPRTPWGQAGSTRIAQQLTVSLPQAAPSGDQSSLGGACTQPGHSYPAEISSSKETTEADGKFGHAT
jgi:hypothetical protein